MTVPMTPKERRRASRVLYTAAAAGLGLAALGLLVAALSGTGMGELRRLAIPAALLALVAGFIALNGWRLDRAAAEALAGVDEQAAADREQLEALRREHAEHEQRRRSELQEARTARERLSNALRVEREWTRELRSQVMRMHSERGTLGDVSDVRELILHVAVQLLEAEKGLLLAREDQDDDGNLDVVCSVGFHNDPEQSALVQRLGGAVMERDQVIRENRADSQPESDQTPADEEIECLVAIPIYIQDRFSGAVVCANKQGGFSDHEDEVLLALGDHAGAVMHNGRLHGELRSAYVGTVRVLAEAIEAKDRLLSEHSDLVSTYVTATAEQLGLDSQARERLGFASLLHDVGKIGISESILLKPGPLTPEERSVVELHPRIGARLVEQVPALRSLTPSILHHHERWDGEGYPSRLRGEEIPLEARIICVADCFSAMVADRPYRRGMSHDDACAELERCAGTQFDPEIVRVFVAQVRRDEGRALEPHSLAAALEDPELAVRAEPGAAVLGQRSVRLTDSLTGLYSHRYMHELVASETERATVQARPYAVVMARLTELERINREEGYERGDGAIRAAAVAVQAAAARCGGTACRDSGDRLALVVPGVGETRAEALRDELARDLGDLAQAAVTVAVWRAGDRPHEVVERARADAPEARGVAAPAPAAGPGGPVA